MKCYIQNIQRNGRPNRQTNRLVFNKHKLKHSLVNVCTFFLIEHNSLYININYKSTRRAQTSAKQVISQCQEFSKKKSWIQMVITYM